MSLRSSIALVAALVSVGLCSAAKADCESDMLQLEAALKTTSLKPDAKAALDEARTKSVSALKKDDDATCHKAIADGLAKAGVPMK
jgi:hypothetical protein